MVVTIEYCKSWNYLPKTVSLVDKLLSKFKNEVDELTIVPSSGGVFEVSFDGELIFSKKELDRFPDEDEVESVLRKKIHF